MSQDLRQIVKQAKSSASTLRLANTALKNTTLLALIDALDKARTAILKANQLDIENGKNKGLTSALLDRLMLDNARIDAMIMSLKQIIALPDPVGSIENLRYLPSGIQVGKMATPLGVIAMIYESRPNVTIDAAALCLKSGNAVILKGGSEALESNKALYQCLQVAFNKTGFSQKAVQLITSVDRKVVGEIVRFKDDISAVIPRGGKGLVEAVSQQATVPVIKHLHGVCHTYIDKFADIDMAIKIAFNAKTRRYGVCNAMETLLVHEKIAATVLPTLIKKYQDFGVEIRGCVKTKALATGVVAATEDDWYEEYLDAILAVRVVSTMAEAMAHIETYGSQHTESIVTNDYGRGRLFLTMVDSSSVMINASTAFADGFEYGLGAEIGISTDKIHVRGPVGLEGLTSKKFVVLADGHIRS